MSQPQHRPREEDRHLIGTFVADFTIAGTDGPLGAPERLAQQVRTELLPALEEAVADGRLAEVDAVVDRLEVDLGHWPAAPDWPAVRTEFRLRFLAALSPYLRPKRPAPRAPEDAPAGSARLVVSDRSRALGAMSDTAVSAVREPPADSQGEMPGPADLARLADTVLRRPAATVSELLSAARAAEPAAFEALLQSVADPASRDLLDRAARGGLSASDWSGPTRLQAALAAVFAAAGHAPDAARAFAAGMAARLLIQPAGKAVLRQLAERAAPTKAQGEADRPASGGAPLASEDRPATPQGASVRRGAADALGEAVPFRARSEAPVDLPILRAAWAADPASAARRLARMELAALRALLDPLLPAAASGLRDRVDGLADAVNSPRTALAAVLAALLDNRPVDFAEIERLSNRREAVGAGQGPRPAQSETANGPAAFELRADGWRLVLALLMGRDAEVLRDDLREGEAAAPHGARGGAAAAPLARRDGAAAATGARTDTPPTSEVGPGENKARGPEASFAERPPGSAAARSGWSKPAGPAASAEHGSPADAVGSASERRGTTASATASDRRRGEDANTGQPAPEAAPPDGGAPPLERVAQSQIVRRGTVPSGMEQPSDGTARPDGLPVGGRTAPEAGTPSGDRAASQRDASEASGASEIGPEAGDTAGVGARSADASAPRGLNRSAPPSDGASDAAATSPAPERDAPGPEDPQAVPRSLDTPAPRSDAGRPAQGEAPLAAETAGREAEAARLTEIASATADPVEALTGAAFGSSAAAFREVFDLIWAAAPDSIRLDVRSRMLPLPDAFASAPGRDGAPDRLLLELIARAGPGLSDLGQILRHLLDLLAPVAAAQQRLLQHLIARLGFAGPSRTAEMGPRLHAELRRIYAGDTARAAELPRTHPTAADAMEQRSERSLLTGTAGLVLFHPFLKLLFSRLDLLTPAGRMAAENLASGRAALEALAGAPEPRQGIDPLVRLLLGMTDEAPPPPRTELDEAQAGLVDGLLRSVIAQWAKLGQTSPAGLQEAFVRRGGQIRFDQAGAHLWVDPGPFDMLLDSLPWALDGTIALPWMDTPCHVIWRAQDG